MTPSAIEPADSGAPPPSDMPAVVDHDGVTWSLPRRPALQVAAVVACLGLPLGGFGFGAAVGAASLVAAVVPLLVFLQLSRHTMVRVTMRSVIVETRGLFGGIDRIYVPLDEIRELRVAVATSGDHAIVVGTGDTHHRVGAREPRPHLVWLHGRIEHARALFAAHEQREGREWTFLRKVPSALGELLDHTTDETPVTRP